MGRSKEKVFSNRCNKTKCKKKELVPLICDTCKLNFCLTHRHPADHDCQGPKKPSNRAAEAAAARSRVSTTATGQSKISEFFSGPFRQADSKLEEADHNCLLLQLQQLTDRLDVDQLQVDQ